MHASYDFLYTLGLISNINSFKLTISNIYYIAYYIAYLRNLFYNYLVYDNMVVKERGEAT